MAEKSSPPGSRGVETSSFKDEMDAKQFNPPGPRPTDFLYSTRTVIGGLNWAEPAPARLFHELPQQRVGIHVFVFRVGLVMLLRAGRFSHSITRKLNIRGCLKFADPKMSGVLLVSLETSPKRGTLKKTDTPVLREQNKNNQTTQKHAKNSEAMGVSPPGCWLPLGLHLET